MNLHELARRLAVVANVLITASLFFVLIWWTVSVTLFFAGWAVYAVAWLIDGSVLNVPSIPTAPE